MHEVNTIGIKDNEEKENEYENQIRYIKARYPRRKVMVVGHALVEQDAVSNHADLHSIIKNKWIRCGYCNRHVVDDWTAVFHCSPKMKGNQNKPIDLYFFCSSKQCASKWQQRMEKYAKHGKGNTPHRHQKP